MIIKLETLSVGLKFELITLSNNFSLFAGIEDVSCQKRGQYNRSRRSDRNIQAIKERLDENPEISVRALARELNLRVDSGFEN